MKKKEPVVCPQCKKSLPPTKFGKFPPHKGEQPGRTCPMAGERV